MIIPDSCPAGAPNPRAGTDTGAIDAASRQKDTVAACVNS